MADDIGTDELIIPYRDAREEEKLHLPHDAWGGNPEALVGCITGLLVDAWSDRDRLDALMERFNSPDRSQQDVMALMYFVREKILAASPRL